MLKVDPKVQELIEKATTGALDVDPSDFAGSQFGLYLPTYVDGDTVKMMEEGYSQTEADLRITVTKNALENDPDAKTVGWIGSTFDKDSKCRHGGTASCKHCTSHPSNCRHCTGHKDFKFGDDVSTPQLDYEAEASKIAEKQELLGRLAKDNFGISLLHAHSSQYEFAQLPEDLVAVISNGKTNFRNLQDVVNDKTFVPNTWRYVGEKLIPSGGYSLKE